MLWPPDAKSRLIGKDLDAGKDRRQKEKEMTEDQMVVWHQFEQFWEMVKDSEAWHAAVRGVTKSQTRLND